MVGAQRLARVLVVLLDAAACQRPVTLRRQADVDLALGHGRRRPVEPVICPRAVHVHRRLPDGGAGGRVECVEIAVTAGLVDGQRVGDRIR